MRVLEATDFYYPWIAGPAPFIQSLATGLSDRGHEVVIACPSPDGHPQEDPGPPHLHRVRTWPVPFGYEVRAGVPFLDLSKLIGSFQPDLVHIHHPFPISLAALANARARRIPVLATNHTIPDCTLYGVKSGPIARPARTLLSWHIRHVLSACNAVTTPTPTAARMLRDIGFKGHAEPISNGVDTDVFYPTSESRNQPPVVLYTGRLDAEKEVETLIRAIPIVLDELVGMGQPMPRFRIGGEGSDKPRLQSLVRDLKLDGCVAFTGYVPMKVLPDVYREATMYAMCSPVELQSISTLEAIASGLPVAAVNAGALPELVRPGINGYLARPGDPRSFARAVVDILSSETHRRELALGSRRIAENHSAHQMVNHYEKLMKGVAEKRPRSVVYGAARG